MNVSCKPDQSTEAYTCIILVSFFVVFSLLAHIVIHFGIKQVTFILTEENIGHFLPLSAL